MSEKPVVLISIKPKWCELIASEKKTVEVRKTKPKLQTPFKCYIYCTKPSFPHEDFLVFDAGTNKIKAFYGGGKVIGEFICDQVHRYAICGTNQYDKRYCEVDPSLYIHPIDYKPLCLSEEEFISYGNGVELFGWHISNPVIYDTPKELGEFQRACSHKEDCCTCKRWNNKSFQCIAGITRPPQSWCYAEKELSV